MHGLPDNSVEGTVSDTTAATACIACQVKIALNSESSSMADILKVMHSSLPSEEVPHYILNVSDLFDFECASLEPLAYPKLPLLLTSSYRLALHTALQACLPSSLFSLYFFLSHPSPALVLSSLHILHRLSLCSAMQWSTTTT